MNNKLVSEKFEYKSTDLGEKIVNLAKRDGKIDFSELYTLFLSGKYHIPAQESDGEYYPILSTHKNGNINFVLFEKEDSLKKWHKNNKYKVANKISTIKVTGRDFVNEIYSQDKRKLDVYLHFGKQTYFVFTQKMMENLLK